MKLGGGDLQIPGTNVGPVKQQLDKSPQEFWERALSMYPSRETAKERGGGPASISNIPSGSGAGGITLWGGDLGFVGGDVPESGGSARELPQTDGGVEGKAAEGRELEKRGSGEGVQGSGYPGTGGVH